MAKRRLYPIREAAAETGYTEKGFRNLVAKRLVAVVKIGRSIRVSAEELDRLCVEGSVPARRQSAA